MEKVKITIYGAEQICASCVGAPGSKDTYEWLQAAIGRKYDDEPIEYEYVDIDKQPHNEKHRLFIERMEQEDLFYPVVLVDEEIVAEGIPRLKTIYQQLDKYGLAAKS